MGISSKRSTVKNSRQTRRRWDNSIRVFVRIRPPGDDEAVCNRVVEVDPSGTQVVLKNTQIPRVFSFDAAYDVEATQESIFSSLGKKVIENCVAGYNGTIFAYGQTGSGKTFTMLGPSEDADNFQHELRGVIPRSFEYLYNLIKREKELHGDYKQFLCKCSFLEIYNEQIFDLLEPTVNSLQLRESLKTGVYVAGLSEKVVSDASEAYEVLNSSWMNRRVAATSMNRESSRSHAVFCLQIESKEKKGAVEHIRTSQLNLVDLAGSERQKDTGASGLRLKEAGSINKSLSNLGNVIMCLVSVSRDGKKRFIPYRDSKLTFLLRDSLGGNSKTSLIACVHPGSKCLGETLSTLQFAKRAKMIKNKAILNENARGNVEQLQAEIRSLKEELRTLKAGTMVIQPSSSSEPVVDSTHGFKNLFIHAMYLQRKTNFDNEELKNEIERLKVVSEKKDKALQTNKMIIKFRENTINLLEKKIKGGDLDDNKLAELIKEFESLKSSTNQNPEIARLTVETRQLRDIIQTFWEKGEADSGVKLDMASIQQLEDEYNQLVAKEAQEQEGDTTTPQRTETVSMASLEKLRSQVANLEEANQALQKEMSEAKKDAEKKEMKLISELESSRKALEELEKMKSIKDKINQMESADRNERHRQTVIAITTPKKEAYCLRNRTVTAKATPDLDDTIPFEDPAGAAAEEEEGILGMAVPNEILQQTTDALLEQSKHWEDKCARLETEVQEFETERVRAIQRQTELESQLRQIEQVLERERAQAAEILKDRDGMLKDWKNKEEDLRIAQEKCQDLDIQVSSYEKRLKESLVGVIVEREKQESKFSILENNFEKVVKETQDLKEQLEKTEMKLETTAETLNIIESLNQELNETSTQKDKAIEDLTAKLRELMQELESKQQEKEMTESQHQEQEAEIQRWQEDYKKTLKTLEKEQARVIQLEKNLRHTEETLTKQFSRQTEDSAKIDELRQQLDNRVEEIKFYKSSEEQHSREMEQLKSTYEGKEASLRAEIEELQERCEEISCLQTVVTDMTEDKERLQQQIAQLEADIGRVTEENQRLKESRGQTETDIDQLKRSLEDLENSRQKNVDEISTLKTKLQEAKDGEEEAQAKYRELNNTLQTTKSNLEVVTKSNAMLEGINSNLRSQVNHLRLDFAEKKRELDGVKEENDRLQDTNKELLEYKDRLIADAKKKEAKISDIETRLEQLQAEKDSLYEENIRLIGHGNLKQKIRHVEDLKKQLATSRKENVEKDTIIQKQMEQIRIFKERTPVKERPEPARDQPLKENKPPS